MDLIKAIQYYVERMLAQTSGMKMLLLDEGTTGIISVVSTQSFLLSKETYLVDKIQNSNRENMKHMKCIVFARPTDSSITSIANELLNPKYSEYYIFFSNTIKKSVIETLAEHDEFEVVREIQEFYADYLAVLPNMFNLKMDLEEYPMSAKSDVWSDTALTRSTQGLMSVFLSLKTRPSLIRYEANSSLAYQLAKELSYQIDLESSLFSYKPNQKKPLLVILDRKNDPVTPLLKQWTYQAMIHEIFGIDNGRVDLSDAPGIRPEHKEIVLSTEQDEFFRKSRLLNFGDLGISIKDYVSSFQQASQMNQKLESIADMKNFVENYPEFRKLSGNVTKHVTLVGELSRMVSERNLLMVSELEQDLACTERLQADKKDLTEVINNPKVSLEDKMCCILIYMLRYEKSQPQMVIQLKDLLAGTGFSEKSLAALDMVLEYAGYRKRQGDLFNNENIFSLGKSVIRGLKGVDNVYTQHTSNYVETLVKLVRAKPNSKVDAILPAYIPHETNSGNYNQTLARPITNQTIIVFFVGGVTYAEEADIVKLKSQLADANLEIIIGGTNIIDSKMFLNQVTGFPDK